MACMLCLYMLFYYPVYPVKRACPAVGVKNLFQGMKMANVLIIDDDEGMCKMLTGMVEDMGHYAAHCLSLKDGLDEALATSYDVVFLDVRMPDGSGLDILPKIRQTHSAPEVIIVTGHGDPDGAEIAIKNGAWDYLQKPISPKKILLPLSRVLRHRDEKVEEKQRFLALKKENIIGHSAIMSGCYDLLAQAAGSDTKVLVTGETGTGKDLFSRAIHENSSRASNRFVVVDCAALPDTIVESVLFGHVKGAYTGAEKAQEGMIKQADQGTLFLDEVGELPLSIQKTFLRVLQDYSFRFVGGKQEVKSDFRLISATNRNLEEMVQEGTFREDLLYRLNAFTIKLPSLKEHLEDIKDIVLYHIGKFCERNEIGPKGCSPEFLESLEHYNWPGNVRELINTLETALTTARQEDTLLANHLPVHIRIHLARASIKGKTGNNLPHEQEPSSKTSLPNFRQLIEKTEYTYFKELISHTKGDIRECCNISGLSRSRFYALLKKHNITRTFE